MVQYLYLSGSKAVLVSESSTSVPSCSTQREPGGERDRSATACYTRQGYSLIPNSDKVHLTWDSDQALAWERDQALIWESDQALTWESDQALAWERDQALTWESNHALTWERDQALTWERDQALTWESNHALTWERDQALTWERDQALTYRCGGGSWPVQGFEGSCGWCCRD